MKRLIGSLWIVLWVAMVAAAFSVPSQEEKELLEQLQEAQRKVEAAPEDPLSQLQLAGLLFELKRYPEALEAFMTSIQLAPDSYPPWIGLGMTQDQLSDHEQALMAFERAIELKKDSADAHFRLGRSHF